jgi:glycosyltransferase involved in cell wall biosynthesis
MNSLFISLDFGTNSSGNLVSKHELEALKLFGNVIQLGYHDISPSVYNLPDNPFLMDYLTLNRVPQLDLTDIDLVHFYGGPYTQTIRYLKAKGIMVSLTLDAHDRMESIKEFGNLGYEYPFKHVSDERLWAIFNGAAHEADIVIVPSMVSAEFLKQEGVDNRNIRIIPHGINVPENWGVTKIPDQFNVGYLGQYGPDKGVRYLIEAWSRLDYKDSTLIFGGANSKSIGPFINKYAITGNFNLLGYVNDVADFYNNVSVYIQPSVTEGFGMTVIQAMSYGRPVICSNGAGAVDTIEDGVNGFIVDKRDPGAIADKIQYFKDNPKEIEKMGNNARGTSLNYSWNKVEQRYIDVWKEIM